MAEHRGGSGNFAEDREKKHLKPDVKADSTAAGILKNDPERASEAGKKAVKTAMAAAVNPVIASL